MVLRAPGWSPPMPQWRDKPSASARGHPEQGTGSGTPLRRSSSPTSQPFPETISIFWMLPGLSAFQVNGIFAHGPHSTCTFQSLPTPRPARGSSATRWVNIQRINFHVAPSGPLWTSGSAQTYLKLSPVTHGSPAPVGQTALM